MPHVLSIEDRHNMEKFRLYVDLIIAERQAAIIRNGSFFAGSAILLHALFADRLHTDVLRLVLAIGGFAFSVSWLVIAYMASNYLYALREHAGRFEVGGGNPVQVSANLFPRRQALGTGMLFVIIVTVLVFGVFLADAVAKLFLIHG